MKVSWVKLDELKKLSTWTQFNTRLKKNSNPPTHKNQSEASIELG